MRMATWHRERDLLPPVRATSRASSVALGHGSWPGSWRCRLQISAFFGVANGSFDTLVENVIVPRIQAQLEIHRGKPDAAVQTLAPAQAYEDGIWFQTHVLRGNAYLASGKPGDGVQEFRKFLARQTLQLFSFQWTLAQLGLARAAAAQHEATNARTAYQDFFALWRDADPDIPILKEAKAEYAKLQYPPRGAPSATVEGRARSPQFQ